MFERGFETKLRTNVESLKIVVSCDLQQFLHLFDKFQHCPQIEYLIISARIYLCINNEIFSNINFRKVLYKF